MRVCIVFGGPSREHDVSVRSARNVARAAMQAGHIVWPVHWLGVGSWRFPAEVPDSPDMLDRFFGENPAGETVATDIFLAACGKMQPDGVFPVLHGPWGEDGRIQGFFQVAGIPVVGHSVLASAISMDKLITKKILQAAGLPTARYLEIMCPGPEDALKSVLASTGFPCVLKAPSEGSSFGISIVHDEQQFLLDFPSIFAMEKCVLVEEFFAGRELTCGVLMESDGSLRPLVPTEIVPKVSKYFDYKAKYDEGGSDEITPARITPEQTLAIQEMAVRVHRELRLGFLSRVDFMLQEPDTWIILEANSLPGFTAQSLFPQAAAAVGMPFQELVQHLLTVKPLR